MISEKNILSQLDHPFIVRLAGTFQGKDLLISQIFDNAEFNLVTFT